jgi:hypothetical protein
LFKPTSHNVAGWINDEHPTPTAVLRAHAGFQVPEFGDVRLFSQSNSNSIDVFCSSSLVPIAPTAAAKPMNRSISHDVLISIASRQTPIDEVDAAARIVDRIVVGVAGDGQLPGSSCCRV